MKFYVDYFGCRSNQAEIQEWIVVLENSGYRLTSDIFGADFGILNTCCVTKKAETDILKFIDKVYKKNNVPWIIAGCTVSKDKLRLKERFKNYYFFDNQEKERLVEFVKQTFPVHHNVIYHSAFKSKFFLKIQDGCNFRCSFCIVPFLRGKSRSLPPAEVIGKARYYASLGYREIVLTGINLSAYGYDLFPRENLLDIIHELDLVKDIDFIRLSSLDPQYIKFSFVKELSTIKKIAPSFHFSFQSGSDAVLRRMKRGGKTLDYIKMLEDFRKFFPQSNLGADIMVGFPGETEKEFNETLDFILESRLNYIHIFPFSPREGTLAERMELIPIDVVRRRVKEMKEINRAIRLEYRERFVEKTVEGILIEETGGYCLVISSNFLSIKVPHINGHKKRKLLVRIDRTVNENLCEGTIVLPRAQTLKSAHY